MIDVSVTLAVNVFAVGRVYNRVLVANPGCYIAVSMSFLPFSFQKEGDVNAFE